MPALQKLISFHIIEKDKSTPQWLMSWTYPTIEDTQRAQILRKLDSNPTVFTYLRLRNNWIYINYSDVFDSDQLPDIKIVALVLIAADFQPDKYETLGKMMSKCYCRTGTPIELVQLYLSVYTTGACSTQENGTFAFRDFDRNSGNSTNIKELIKMFGLEIILIYTAILLKKKVILYHHSQETLLKLIPSITALIPHRNPNSYLFPIMEVTNESLTELKNSSFFVAGFKDSAIFSKTNHFDLLVNLPATEISTMPHAKESLTMTKTHKDIAIFMVQLAENAELNETQVQKEITKKTTELLSYLKSLSANSSSDGSLTVDDIKSKNLHPYVENFLINLAMAENMIF